MADNAKHDGDEPDECPTIDKLLSWCSMAEVCLPKGLVGVNDVAHLRKLVEQLAAEIEDG